MRESAMHCIEAEPGTFQCGKCEMRISDDLSNCPAHWFFHLFGNKWTTPILGSLRHQTLRFSQLRKLHLPISERMLILSLRKLEDAGFVVRVQAEDSPDHPTYQITNTGQSLLAEANDLLRWMHANAATIRQSYKASVSGPT